MKRNLKNIENIENKYNLVVFRMSIIFLFDTGVKNFTETNIKGNVIASKDGLLYTSIPVNKHWTAYVNGVKSEIVPIGGAMIALPLTAGTHYIEFMYFNKDLLFGIIISLVSLVLFAINWQRRGKPS